MTTVGYTLAINNDYGSFGTGSSLTTTSSPLYNSSTRTEEFSNYSLRRIYGLIEMGIDLELQLNQNTSIYLNGNYMAGLHRVVETNVEYSINEGPTQTATVFSNGDYFCVVLGVGKLRT